MSQRRFAPGAFYAEYESLVRRVISARLESGLDRLGAEGKFIYLVRGPVKPSLLEINDQLARSFRQQGNDAAAARMIKLNESLTPYVGMSLLTCGIWLDGLRHELHIDDKKELLVHRSTGSHPDPDSAYAG